jgi:hypothetical protein
MCFKQNVVYLVDQEHHGLRSIGPVSENLLFRKKISENLVERELLQAQELTQGSLK